MYDIVFLSYHETHAEKHWELVRKRFPRAKHIKGIDGLPKAHHVAAEQCKTRYFWVIDADNIVSDDFDLSFWWDRRDDIHDRVAVWRAKNNVNGLEYGYGGIKLLPRRAVLKVSLDVADFTTSISDHFHIMDEVASTTIINSSPFDAWRSAFRECVKLSSGTICGSNTEEDTLRLEVWREHVYKVPNREYILLGARHGIEYGTKHARDFKALRLINDWRWLNDKFCEGTAAKI